MARCRIAEAIRLKHKPVALHWSDDKPENVVQFDKGSWGCVMFLVVAAAKGEIAVLDRDTCGCVGGAVGMGFGTGIPTSPEGSIASTTFCLREMKGGKRAGKRSGKWRRSPPGRNFWIIMPTGRDTKRIPGL